MQAGPPNELQLPKINAFIAQNSIEAAESVDEYCNSEGGDSGYSNDDDIEEHL